MSENADVSPAIELWNFPGSPARHGAGSGLMIVHYGEPLLNVRRASDPGRRPAGVGAHGRAPLREFFLGGAGNPFFAEKRGSPPHFTETRCLLYGISAAPAFSRLSFIMRRTRLASSRGKVSTTVRTGISAASRSSSAASCRVVLATLRTVRSP